MVGTLVASAFFLSFVLLTVVGVNLFFFKTRPFPTSKANWSLFSIGETTLPSDFSVAFKTG